MKFRKPTYGEFVSLMAEALSHEYSEYRKHVPHERVRFMVENEPDDLWNFEGMESEVTEDGKSIIVTVPNSDGSKYIYSVFVDKESRNMGIGTELIKRVLASSPKGCSLHVHNKDLGAQRLYKRLGFKPYGMGLCGSIFFATKKGIAGRFEWGQD